MMSFAIVGLSNELSFHEHPSMFDIDHTDTYIRNMSTVLGYIVVISALIVKFPQIFKIYTESSVIGISLTTFYIEALGYSMLLAYSIHDNRPVSTYGEYASLAIQSLIQLLLYWKTGKIAFKRRLLIGTLITFGWLIPLFFNLVPNSFWKYVPINFMLMNVVMKLSQIKTNYINESTGSLSFFTNYINFQSALIRILTTIVELNDPFLLANYILVGVMNIIIMGQFRMYKRPKIHLV